MSPFEYIKNSIFVKLKPSRISGVGVFAIKDIPKGVPLFQTWDGETGFFPLSLSEIESLDTDLQYHIKDLFLYSSEFPFDTNIYVKLTQGCHWIYTNPYYFVNSGFYENKSNIDKTSMMSLRDIKKGEEILSNYERYEKIDKTII